MISWLGLLSAAAVALQGAPATPVADVPSIMASIADCSAAVDAGIVSLPILEERGWKRESRDEYDQAGLPPGAVMSRGPDPRFSLFVPGEEPGSICHVIAVGGARSGRGAVESRLREMTGDNQNRVHNGDRIFVGGGRLYALHVTEASVRLSYRVAVMKAR